MIPSKIVQEAKDFLERIEERNEANEAEEYDAAFEIECSQRDNGAEMAEWIIKKASEQKDVTSVCPHCGGADIVADGNPEHGADTLWQKIECENCGETWNDVYEFAFWEPRS